jgi:hypothetical protein
LILSGLDPLLYRVEVATGGSIREYRFGVLVREVKASDRSAVSSTRTMSPVVGYVSVEIPVVSGVVEVHRRHWMLPALLSIRGPLRHVGSVHAGDWIPLYEVPAHTVSEVVKAMWQPAARD